MRQSDDFFGKYAKIRTWVRLPQPVMLRTWRARNCTCAYTCRIQHRNKCNDIAISGNTSGPRVRDINLRGQNAGSTSVLVIDIERTKLNMVICTIPRYNILQQVRASKQYRGCYYCQWGEYFDCFWPGPMKNVAIADKPYSLHLYMSLYVQNSMPKRIRVYRCWLSFYVRNQFSCYRLFQ